MDSPGHFLSVGTWTKFWTQTHLAFCGRCLWISSTWSRPNSNFFINLFAGSEGIGSYWDSLDSMFRRVLFEILHFVIDISGWVSFSISTGKRFVYFYLQFKLYYLFWIFHLSLLDLIALPRFLCLISSAGISCFIASISCITFRCFSYLWKHFKPLISTVIRIPLTVFAGLRVA